MFRKGPAEMAKRKAKDLDEAAVGEEPRRSSRRVAAPKETKSKSTPTSKPAKKVRKPAKEEELPTVNGQDDKNVDAVGLVRCDFLPVFTFL